MGNPGENCMRCGTRSDIIEGSDGRRIYVCPRGHGEQGTVPAEAEAPAQAPEKRQEEEEEETEPAKPAHRNRPPPHKQAEAVHKKAAPAPKKRRR